MQGNNLYTNLETKVKSEIDNVMKSVEYLKEYIDIYFVYNEGLETGRKTNILSLKKQILDNHKQIAYLQGNNDNYGIDIVQLKDNIKNEIKDVCNVVEKNLNSVSVIQNIFKLTNARVCEIIDKNFDNYFFRKIDNSDMEV